MRPRKQPRPDQVGSPSARELLQAALGDDEEDPLLLLHDLETSDSLLSGMFRGFLKEAGVKPTQMQVHTHHQQQQQHAKRPRDTELVLKVSLEELYNGCCKMVPVQRRKHDGLGHVVPVQENLQVQVQPGLKEGTRITLPGLGHEDYQGDLSNLTFIVQQQLHPAFRRLADDLYAIVNVPLVTALTGGAVNLKTLDGQLLQLPVGDIITPGSELVLPNQGMPVFGDASGRHGALHVKFNVNFPQQLSVQQMVLLRQALSGCEFPVQPQRGLQGLPAAAESAAQQQTPAQWQQQQQQHVHIKEEDDQQQQQQQLPAFMRHQQAAAAVKGSPNFSFAAFATAGRVAAGVTTAAADKCMYYAAGAVAGSSASGSASSSVSGFACTHSTGSSGRNS